jgi:hypothetical protein
MEAQCGAWGFGKTTRRRGLDIGEKALNLSPCTGDAQETLERRHCEKLMFCKLAEAHGNRTLRHIDRRSLLLASARVKTITKWMMNDTAPGEIL